MKRFRFPILALAASPLRVLRDHGFTGSRFTFLALLITFYSSLFTLQACNPKTKGKSTIQVYREAMGAGSSEIIKQLQEDFKREQPLGYEEPVVPMVVPPETLLIWFGPQTVGEEVFVHGHWVQLVVRPWGWNQEILSHPVGEGGDAPSVQLPLHPESKPKEKP